MLIPNLIMDELVISIASGSIQEACFDTILQGFRQVQFCSIRLLERVQPIHNLLKQRKREHSTKSCSDGKDLNSYIVM